MPKSPHLPRLHQIHTINHPIRKTITPRRLIRRYPHDTSFIAWLLSRKTRSASPHAGFFTQSQVTFRGSLNAAGGGYLRERKSEDCSKGEEAKEEEAEEEGGARNSRKEESPKMSDPTQNPSQLHGHASYVAGAAKEALGFESGKDDKEYAVQEMRAAKEQAEQAGECA